MIENAKKEYFELVVLLNRGNKLKNEDTVVEFKIEYKRVYAFIKNRAKLVLAEYNNGWKPISNTKFDNLVLQVCKILNRHNSSDLNSNITEIVKDSLFKYI